MDDRPALDSNPDQTPFDMERTVQAIKDLFTSDVGLMSLGSIVFMLGMGVFYLRYFLKHMHEDEAKAAKH